MSRNGLMGGGAEIAYVQPGNISSFIQGSSSVAAALLNSGFNVNALRTNDVLRKEEWLLFDRTVIQVARQRLVGVADLMDRGLSVDLPNGLGTTQIQWETVNHMEDADVSMSGVTEGERDRVVYSLKTLPLPIIHKDFSINIRALEASRRSGEPLDVTMADQAARLVTEKIEDILFNGHTITVSGQQIQGYTTATNRNTGSLNAGDWSVVGATGEEIIQDVLAMIAKAYEDKMYGPFVLYLPIDYFIKIGDDYKAASDRTILERIQAIPGIAVVKPSENLSGGASGEALLVQMSREVVDIVNGLQPTTVAWETHGGMQFRFKVMAIMIPRMKSSATNQSGIVHFSV